MALNYVILDKEDRIPVVIADSLEKAKELIDEFVVLVKKFPKSTGVYLGFQAYDSEHPDIFEGVYSYSTDLGTLKYLRYCMVVNDLN